jgi:hypothetical protein
MSTLLFEQPWIIGVLGAIVTGATLFGWLQSGSIIALRSAGGFLIATLLLVLLNVWVVTEREILRSWLSETASELEQNQVDKVLKRIHPEASERVADRARMLKNIKFTSVRITKIHGIDIKSTRKSSQAVIRMNVFAEGEMRHAAGKAPRWIGLTLEKTDGVWMVADVEEKDPMHEFMNRE